MITIYYDFQRTQQITQDKYTRLVNQASDYIPLRQLLRQALDDVDHNYYIYVQSHLLVQWLKDLRDYGPQIIRWIEVDLREQFREKFGILPPVELDEMAINDLQLLSRPSLGDAAMNDITGWVLSQCINDVWAYTRPYKGHLADLAAWAIHAENLPDSLTILIRKRLMQWAEADSRYQIFLEQNCQDAGKSLLLRWALRTYPIQFNLCRQLDSVPLEDCSRYANSCIELLKTKMYDSQLRQFWSSRSAPNSSDDMLLVIQSMSGLTDIELDFFKGWVDTHLSHLTPALLYFAQERFSLLSLTASVFRRLEDLLPSPIPQTPDAKWSVERWLVWATEEYFPYFAWIIRSNQPRDTQIDLANCFADWLVRTYSTLLFDQQVPISINQLSKIENVLDADLADVVLWFIVDGLTWWQGKKLSTICAEHDIGVLQAQPMLSVLPTTTSISKRALVRGYLERTASNQSIAQFLASRFENKKREAKVYTQHYELRKTLESDIEPGIYTLFFNDIDHHNHETPHFTDDELVDGYLNFITRMVKEGFQQCLRQGLRVKAFVSSDHGSTLLPSQEPVLKVPSFANEVEDDDTPEEEFSIKTKQIPQSTRICATEKTPTESDLKLIEKDWYFLRQDIYNLPSHFLIPKGYDAVKRRPKGWTHGGATPEETIVAFIELQPSPIDLIEPLVEIKGFLSPHKTSKLQITFVNPNPIPIKIIQFAISAIAVDLAQNTLKRNSSSIYNADVLITVDKGSTETIEWVLTCEGNGLRKHFRGLAEVPIRRLQISAVDEMFENM